MLYLKLPVNLLRSKICLSDTKLFSIFQRKYVFKSLQLQCAYCSAISAFDKMLSDRRNQAERSIIVNSHRSDSVEKVITWGSQFGTIKNLFLIKSTPLRFLIEYVKPWQQSSHFLSFTEEEVPSGSAPLEQMPIIITVDNKRPGSVANVHQLLAKQDSIDNQILEFYRYYSIDDVEIRTKFVAALQMEKITRGTFPDAIVYPFGSTVYGLGQHNSDLDLLMEYRYAESIHHKGETKGPAQNKKQLKVVIDHLKQSKDICNVVPILKAVVPLVRYNINFLNLNVDLLLNARDGRKKSELVYLYGEIDSRVRPLILFIRCWARAVGITNAEPGKRLSNFGLTLLSIYFLQQLDQPILPPVNDLEKDQFQSRNVSSMSKLLLQFFDFYSSFDFYGSALSLNTATVVEKPSPAALYVIDPIDSKKNITRAVTSGQCDHLQQEMTEAHFKLGNEIGRKRENRNCWGTLLLFEKNKIQLDRI